MRVSSLVWMLCWLTPWVAGDARAQPPGPQSPSFGSEQDEGESSESEEEDEEEEPSDGEDEDTGEDEDGGDGSAQAAHASGAVKRAVQARMDVPGANQQTEPESEEDAGPLFGHQVEAAVVSNSIWRGAALWTPSSTPGLVAFGEARAEDVGRFDFSLGVWTAVPLSWGAPASQRRNAWFVPSLTGTLWVTDEAYVTLGYATYLQSGVAHPDYQHDFACAFGYELDLAHGFDVSVSAESNADPIRRLGVYVHGDSGLGFERGAWYSNLSVEIGGSRYRGSDAVPWGLQAIMGTLSVRRTLPATLYVELAGITAYSNQAYVWGEGHLNTALSLAIGSER